MSFITPSTTLPKSHYPNNKTAGIPRDSGFLSLSFYFGKENKNALLLSVNRSFFYGKTAVIPPGYDFQRSGKRNPPAAAAARMTYFIAVPVMKRSATA